MGALTQRPSATKLLLVVATLAAVCAPVHAQFSCSNKPTCK
eukprot:COSAG03_NODE_2216_length_2997_cov_2.050035_1_plen_41_part_00